MRRRFEMFLARAIPVLAGISLVATSLVATPPPPASAAQQNVPVAAAGFDAAVDLRPVVDEETQVDLDSVDFSGRFGGGYVEDDFDLRLDDDGRGSFTLDDYTGAEQRLLLDVETATPERIVFTATDLDTGESYDYDSAVPMKRLAFLIPVAFIAIPAATALYYLAVGAAIVIGGVLALEAGKAIGKIVAANNKKSSKDKRDYYPAQRSGKKVMISPKGYTKAQALSAGIARKDVWALSDAKAKTLAKDLHAGGKVIGKEKHGAGYLWHYHPANHSPEMHAFFGGPA